MACSLIGPVLRAPSVDLAGVLCPAMTSVLTPASGTTAAGSTARVQATAGPCRPVSSGPAVFAATWQQFRWKSKRRLMTAPEVSPTSGNPPAPSPKTGLLPAGTYYHELYVCYRARVNRPQPRAQRVHWSSNWPTCPASVHAFVLPGNGMTNVHLYMTAANGASGTETFYGSFTSLSVRSTPYHRTSAWFGRSVTRDEYSSTRSGRGEPPLGSRSGGLAGAERPATGGDRPIAGWHPGHTDPAGGDRRRRSCSARTVGRPGPERTVAARFGRFHKDGPPFRTRSSPPA